jgi:membrane protein DedA with SNARE-associated domain
VSGSLDFVVRHGYALVFVWILAEQAALPLPSIPILLAAGALARSGRMSLPLVVVVGLAACMIADNTWFLLGRHRGPKVLRFLCRIALEPDSCVRRTENAFLRYGSRLLLVAKFVPGLNAVAAPLAGISRIRPVRFIPLAMLGALAWIVSYTILGYLFSSELDRMGAYAARMGSGFLVLVLALAAAWIAWKFLQRRRFLRNLAVSRITAAELMRKLEAGEEVLVVDVRNSLESDDAVPGALRIPLEELESRHHDIPRDRDLILFCS